MKYTIERLPESRVAIEVEIEAEQVEKALDRAAQRLSRHYRIPGFRPGRAPRRIVEARLGRDTLYEEAIRELANQAYQEILQKGEFEPVHPAELEAVNLEPFSFRLVVPVRPSVRLGDYRTLRFPLEVPEIGDTDVERVLERLQAAQTVWKVPDPPRPARPGDRLTVDLVGHMGEREVERRQEVEVLLDESSLPPGFGALVGAEVGQTMEVQTTLSEDLEDRDLAGQPATYTITIRAIYEPEVPPLDDEFARNYQQESLDALRASIRRELEETAQKQARALVLERMLRALDEGATVEMPQVLVEEVARALYQDREKQLRRLKVSMAQYLQWIGKTEEDLLQELRQVAAERLRSRLVLQEFIRAEGLEGEGDFQQTVEERLLAIARGEIGAEGLPASSSAETVPSGPAGTPPEDDRAPSSGPDILPSAESTAGEVRDEASPASNAAERPSEVSTDG
ncbi:MAG: trigger factor [Chloroflexia bacterium]